MLRNIMKVLVSISLICVFTTSGIADTQPSMSVDFETIQASKYVWRGLVCNNEPVVQPSLTASWQSGVSLNLWGSFDQTDFGDAKGKLSELDYTLSYDWESRGNDWTLGYVAYTYPNDPCPGTGEMLLDCNFGGSWGTNLSLARDVKEADGLYLNLGMARSIYLAGRSVDVSGGLGFTDKRMSSYYYDVPSAGLSDASICLEVPIESHGGWTFTPSMTYTQILRHSLREAVERPDNYIFGIKLNKTF